MIKIIKGKLVAKKRDNLGYETYVFVDVDRDIYVMCTKLPNWELKDSIEVNDVGYVKYKNVIAGQDTYFNNNTGEYQIYKSTDCYIIDYIKQ